MVQSHFSYTKPDVALEAIKCPFAASVQQLPALSCGLNFSMRGDWPQMERKSFERLVRNKDAVMRNRASLRDSAYIASPQSQSLLPTARMGGSCNRTSASFWCSGAR